MPALDCCLFNDLNRVFLTDYLINQLLWYFDLG
jgi:hypothetical protein